MTCITKGELSGHVLALHSMSARLYTLQTTVIPGNYYFVMASLVSLFLYFSAVYNG